MQNRHLHFCIKTLQMQQSLTNVLKSKATCVFNILMSNLQQKMIIQRQRLTFLTDLLAIMYLHTYMQRSKSNHTN